MENRKNLIMFLVWSLFEDIIVIFDIIVGIKNIIFGFFILENLGVKRGGGDIIIIFVMYICLVFFIEEIDILFFFVI